MLKNATFQEKEKKVPFCSVFFYIIVLLCYVVYFHAFLFVSFELLIFVWLGTLKVGVHEATLNFNDGIVAMWANLGHYNLLG